VLDARLIDLARRHTAARRSARREVGEGVSGLADWLAASLTSPSRAVVRAERDARLQDALDGLPAETQELLRLRFAEGLATRDIAARVGKSDDAIRAALSRALRQLEAAFGDSMRPD
jgi:RNA polymerase sigma-70 factor (ECF subfamily)